VLRLGWLTSVDCLYLFSVQQSQVEIVRILCFPRLEKSTTCPGWHRSMYEPEPTRPTAKSRRPGSCSINVVEMRKRTLTEYHHRLGFLVEWTKATKLSLSITRCSIIRGSRLPRGTYSLSFPIAQAPSRDLQASGRSYGHKTSQPISWLRWPHCSDRKNSHALR
jgi:hypothetical protein